MAKDDSSRQGQGGAPPGAEDSLDFTDPVSSKPAAPARRKKAASADLTKPAGSRFIGMPVLIAAAIVVVLVFLLADRSSKEVVTKAPPGKAASLPQKSAITPRPQTGAPAPTAPAFPTPELVVPPPQAPASAGAHRRAIPAEFRKALLEYASRTGGKAIALALDAEGRYAYGSVSGFASHEEAIKEALSDCERYKGSAGVQERCKLYAIGDKIVWQ